MYHAPVNLDLDQPDTEPAELADDGVGTDASSQRLREAHLHNGQAQTRALFAPFFSATAIGGALLVAWAMFGGVSIPVIGGWLVVVGMIYGAYWRRVVRDGAAASSRSAEGQSPIRAI